MSTEPTAGIVARTTTDASRDQKPDADRCACGAPIEGYDAVLDEAVCRECAEASAIVAAAVDQPGTLQAGQGTDEIVDELEDEWRHARHRYGAHKSLEQRLGAKWHAGRADGLQFVIDLLTGEREVSTGD